ncbi:hypothetical protein FJ693_08230 [Georgenia yuyongxinii]|uniref:Cation efflux protein cytoplasmic domain-containing protein n=1 Tax=Georgenia yuyongxinii TaxID=2589797 RepID=A0A552WSE0_9MICO|nr:hypothetical protein FJ693_08230 [Georgenia yuyongxinii]
MPAVRLRWSGHRLSVTAMVSTAPDLTISQFHELGARIDQALRGSVPGVGSVTVSPVPGSARATH